MGERRTTPGPVTPAAAIPPQVVELEGLTIEVRSVVFDDGHGGSRYGATLTARERPGEHAVIDAFSLEELQALIAAALPAFAAAVSLRARRR